MNTVEFIRRSKETHGDRYDYSKSKYVNKNTKVVIICNEHGEFRVRPDSHYNGAHCGKCSRSRQSINRRMSKIEFIRRSKETHGGRYDYSKSKYISAHDKITITCRTHGDFLQSPSSHMRGDGCVKCREITTHKFIEKSKVIHGNFYDYSKSKYLGVHTKLTITCRTHGDFLITPNEHYRGSGCADCSKYSYSKTSKAVLYILISSDFEHAKIGVTHNINRRMRELKNNTPFEFTVSKTICVPTGVEAKLIERSIHSMLTNSGFKGFDGHTEWFMYDKLLELI